MSFSKKCTSLSLAFFLMFSNVGLALNVHFCGEQKIASSLVYANAVQELCDHKDHNHSDGSTCEIEKSCCGSSDSHLDCCSDELITQDTSDVVVFKVFSLNLDAFVIQNFDYSFEQIEYQENCKQNFIEYSYLSNAPPLYKLYCSLIFYA